MSIKRRMLDLLPDKLYLELMFKKRLGYKLDLKNPKTFNEKLQWLKLYDRKPIYTTMVDKYEAKKYVAEKIGEQYIIPALGVWYDPDEIDFDALPDQFVLKCNHNSGLGMCICKDKSKLDIESVKNELRKGLKQNYYLTGREWPYKNVKRRIIAEEFLADDSGEELKDYKVLCFNGKAKLIELHQGRFTDHHTQDFYDINWNKTNIKQIDDPSSDVIMNKPVFLNEMIYLSEVLSTDISHLRIDWYYSNHQLYFGEITFYDASGFGAFENNQDEMIGKWITLPEKNYIFEEK